MLNIQNVSFKNRVIVAIHSIYVILPLLFNLVGGDWSWGVFAFWLSIPLFNALLYWVISGYKKQKGTKFSFIAKLIIALWFPVLLFGLGFLMRFLD